MPHVLPAVGGVRKEQKIVPAVGGVKKEQTIVPVVGGVKKEQKIVSAAGRGSKSSIPAIIRLRRSQEDACVAIQCHPSAHR